MKTLSSFVFALLSLITLASCSREADNVNAATAVEVAGSYRVVEYREDNQLVNLGDLTIDFEFIQLNETQVRQVITYYRAGQQSSRDDRQIALDVKRDGRSLNIYYDDMLTGYLVDDTITLITNRRDANNRAVEQRYTAKRR